MSCRRCKWFMRVIEDKYGLKDIMPRGFCLLGKGEGDFSLYVNYSGARKCPFYEEDDLSREIFEAEKATIMAKHEYWFRAHDRRTRIHRKAKERIGAKNMNIHDIMINRDYWHAVWEIFVEEEAELIAKARDAIAKRSISEGNYHTLIHILTEIANEFLA